MEAVDETLNYLIEDGEIGSGISNFEGAKFTADANATVGLGLDADGSEPGMGSEQ